MGASKTFKQSVRWAGNHSNRGKESGYTKTPIARMEGTHESGGAGLRKGAKGGAGKSKSISGPQRHKAKSASY